MKLQRIYGLGGEIYFSEYEIEVMYYTVTWLSNVILDEGQRAELAEFSRRLEIEINKTGVKH